MLEKIQTDVQSAAQPTLLDLFRQKTKALHTQAERTGIVSEILHGRANIHGYALLLRNLLPVYQTLEQALARRANTRPLGLIVRDELDRAPSLAADLATLKAKRPLPDLPYLPEARAYVRAIEAASRGAGSGLAAHAYARYLGDLSGGQILQKLLGKSLSLSPAELTFYDFTKIADIAAYKAGYRAALEQLGREISDADDVADEGARAFALNIDLSCAVMDAIT